MAIFAHGDDELTLSPLLSTYRLCVKSVMVSGYGLARKKKCIKHAGYTLYPDDVEQVVKSVEGVHQVAALGIESPLGDGESIYVFAESRVHRMQSEDKYHEMAVDIVRKINDHFGI